MSLIMEILSSWTTSTHYFTGFYPSWTTSTHYFTGFYPSWTTSTLYFTGFYPSWTTSTHYFTGFYPSWTTSTLFHWFLPIMNHFHTLFHWFLPIMNHFRTISKGEFAVVLTTTCVGGAYHQKSTLIWTAYLWNGMAHDQCDIKVTYLRNLNFRIDCCRF
jgi:hypothetical protein